MWKKQAEKLRAEAEAKARAYQDALTESMKAGMEASRRGNDLLELHFGDGAFDAGKADKDAATYLKERTKADELQTQQFKAEAEADAALKRYHAFVNKSAPAKTLSVLKGKFKKVFRR